MKNKFMSELKLNGFVTIDNGEYNYNVCKINKENFPDMNEKLEAQLKAENLYNNSFIGYINTPGAKGTVNMLPIYGNKNGYETKWFKNTLEEAANVDLRSRHMGLLKRYI